MRVFPSMGMTSSLIKPLLTAYGESIETIAMRLPARHKLLHERHEPSIVSAFKQMDHFMHHDVLQTLARFFSQLRVKANGPGWATAATPLRLHPLHVEVPDIHANDAVPLRDQSRHVLPDLLSVPTFEYLLLLRITRARTNTQDQHRMF